MNTIKNLANLRCPEDGSALVNADDAVVKRINSAIRRGSIRNRYGTVLEDELDGGLVRAAGDLLYPVVRQIPVLLRDEAISLQQLTGDNLNGRENDLPTNHR